MEWNGMEYSLQLSDICMTPPHAEDFDHLQGPLSKLESENLGLSRGAARISGIV